MVVGGHQPPRGSSEWSRLITYNKNQILEGAAGGGNGLAFVERRVVASTSAMHKPIFRTDAYDEGTAIHRRELHHPSLGVMGGRARLGWLLEARRGGASVIILRLFFRGASTMRRAFE
jgi:hypothetical protein